MMITNTNNAQAIELISAGKEALEKIINFQDGTKITTKGGDIIVMCGNTMTVFHKEVFMIEIGWIDKGRLYEVDLLDPTYNMNTIPNNKRGQLIPLRKEAKLLCMLMHSLMRGKERELLNLQEVACMRCQWYAPGYPCSSHCKEKGIALSA